MPAIAARGNRAPTRSPTRARAREQDREPAELVTHSETLAARSISALRAVSTTGMLLEGEDVARERADVVHRVLAATGADELDGACDVTGGPLVDHQLELLQLDVDEPLETREAVDLRVVVPEQIARALQLERDLFERSGVRLEIAVACDEVAALSGLGVFGERDDVRRAAPSPPSRWSRESALAVRSRSEAARQRGNDDDRQHRAGEAEGASRRQAEGATGRAPLFDSCSPVTVRSVPRGGGPHAAAQC